MLIFEFRKEFFFKINGHYTFLVLFDIYRPQT